MNHAKATEAAFSRNVPLSSYSLHKSYLARTDGTDPEIQKLKNDFQTFASEIKTLLQSKPVATIPPSKPATNNNNGNNNSNQNRPRLQCFNCQRFGHRAAVCTNPTKPPIICHKCGRRGHKANVCQYPAQSNNQSQFNLAPNTFPIFTIHTINLPQNLVVNPILNINTNQNLT